MRFARDLFAAKKLSTATASLLLLAALGSGAGCGARVAVDTTADTASSGHEPPTPPVGPCDALPWSRVFGSASDAAMSTPWTEPQIVADGACNVVVAGTPSSDLDFGGGPFAPGGIFVAKLGAPGDAVWTRQFDATFEALGGNAAGLIAVGGKFDGAVDFGNEVSATADGSAAFLVELDAKGAPLWTRSFSADIFSSRILVDASGAVLLAGNLQGTVDLGAGPVSSSGRATFVAKYDVAGSLVYSHVFPGAATVDAAVDAAGNVLLSGTFAGTLDLGGGPLSTTTPLGNQDLYVASFDPAGQHRWSEKFGGPGSNTYLTRVATDAAGGAYVTGLFGGALDLGSGPLEAPGPSGAADVVPLDSLFVVRLDASGHHVFDRHFGHGLLLPFGLGADGDSVVVAVDSYQTGVDFGGGPLAAPAGYGLFMARFNGAGEHVASRDFLNGSASASASASISANLALDASGKALLVGTVVGSATFESGSLTGSEQGSLFVATLDL